MTETFEEKLKVFLEWSRAVGIKYCDELIQYPVYFQPGNYPGIGVKQNIPANKAVIAVPYTATIVLSKIKQTLGQLFDQIKKQSSKQQFYHIVFTIYLCYQKANGKGSFFYHYFNIVFDLDKLSFWTQNQKLELEDPYIIGVSNFYQKPSQQRILKLQQFSKKYPNLFKKPLTKKDIEWATVFVESRSFETCFPEPIIVPFIDFVNHVPIFNNSSEIYSCKVSYEKGIQDNQGGYIVKNKCLNLSLLDIEQPKDMKRFKPHIKARTLRQYFPEVDIKQIARLQPDYLTKYLSDILPKNPFLTDVLESQDDQQQINQFEVKQKSMKQFFKVLQEKQQPPEKFEQLKQTTFQRPALPIGRQTMAGYDYSGWWKYNDNDTYIILTTSRAMAKGQQLFISYGRKSNINLLTNYGFALQNNRFHSIHFYLKKEVGKIIVHENFLIPDSQQNLLVGIFNLKQTKLCSLLIMYLRLKVLKQKQDYQRKVTYPISLQTELQILDLYEEVLIQLRKIYNTQTLEKDKKLLQEGNNAKRLTFALIYKIENKKIIEISMSILQMTKKIIKDLQNKRDFTEALNDPMPQWEKDELFDNKDGRVFYLRRLLPYLRPLTYLIQK